jgi:tRNA nucleotidyltransferase (CCA-adding enzyme)
VDAAFGIFSEPERSLCIVIGRGQSEGLDVGAIMRSMGGGGHPRAGSAQLKAVHADAVEQSIRDSIQGNQRSSVQISDLMSFPVSTVTSQTTMEEVAMRLRHQGITGIPVVDDGRIVGMISRRDFRRVRKESKLKLPVKAFMSTRVLTIAPGKSPKQAAAIMVKHDVGRLPVVENGQVIGILTRSDVMRFFYDLLPD